MFKVQTGRSGAGKSVRLFAAHLESGERGALYVRFFFVSLIFFLRRGGGTDCVSSYGGCMSQKRVLALGWWHFAASGIRCEQKMVGRPQQQAVLVRRRRHLKPRACRGAVVLPRCPDAWPVTATREVNQLIGASCCCGVPSCLGLGLLASGALKPSIRQRCSHRIA